VEMRKIKEKKAIFLTFSIYSFLLWAYIAGRVIFSCVPPNDLFINGIPIFTFAILGIIAFIASMVFTYMYLTTN